MPFTKENAKEARAKASPRGESKAKRWIREAADKESTIEVFDKLTEMAKSGDMDAIKTFLGYVVGKPKDTLIIAGDKEEPIILTLDERFLKLIQDGA